MNGLTDRIKNYIQTLYCVTFTGKMILNIKDKEYSLDLYLNKDYFAPINITLYCENDDDFYFQICKHLRERELIKIGFYKISLEQ